MKRHIKGNISWIGYIDWELKHFHGDDYSIEQGSSQNAYLIEEEKTVLVDTVWRPHRSEYLDNLSQTIDLSHVDAVVANHGEPDHSGALPELLERLPDVPVFCTKNAVDSLIGQYGDQGWDLHPVKTGDTYDLGNGKQLIFVEMRMLHWPDSMATYVSGDNVLLSNDAFGQHYAVEELFADRADQGILFHEAMKYYTNILNPFSPLVAAKIKEIRSLGLPIDMIAPSHGAIWRENPMQIVDLYDSWANAYQEDQVTVMYDSMWGGTEKIAHALAAKIADISPTTTVKVFSTAKADKNDIMTEIFKSKAIAVGSPTVGRGIMSGLGGDLMFLHELSFKKKKAAVFGCYGWSGECTKVLRTMLTDSGFEVVQPELRAKWTMKETDLPQLTAMATAMLQ